MSDYAHVRSGSFSEISAHIGDFRSSPGNGHHASKQFLPKSATSGLLQCSKKDRYSITSSARCWRCKGHIEAKKYDRPVPRLAKSTCRPQIYLRSAVYLGHVSLNEPLPQMSYT
jgi:hypothetical protein